jgi:hypothetical protein
VLGHSRSADVARDAFEQAADREARTAKATFERLGASRDIAAASQLLVTLGSGR